MAGSPSHHPTHRADYRDLSYERHRPIESTSVRLCGLHFEYRPHWDLDPILLSWDWDVYEMFLLVPIRELEEDC